MESASGITFGEETQRTKIALCLRSGGCLPEKWRSKHAGCTEAAIFAETWRRPNQTGKIESERARERESEQNLFRLLQLFLARNNIKLGFYLTWALG